MLECSLYNSMEDTFQLRFENAVLGSLKSFFQLDYQVDISFYLMDDIAICHSSELVGST